MISLASPTENRIFDKPATLPERALSGLGFAFDSPRDLTSQQLYLLFLAWAELEALNACYHAEAGSYVFSADTIYRTLDRYLGRLTAIPLFRKCFWMEAHARPIWIPA